MLEVQEAYGMKEVHCVVCRQWIYLVYFIETWCPESMGRALEEIEKLFACPRGVTESNIRHKDFRPSVRPPSVTLTVPPLDSETGWTGELWSKTNLLQWQN